MTKRNSVHEMVDALKRIGPMVENEIHKAAFGYDRSSSSLSNKKYADMLRRGLAKGIIGRMEWPKEAIKYGRSQFIYYATKTPEVECFVELEKDLNENVKKIVTDNANKIYEETGLVYDNETETWNETSDMGSFDENGDIVDHSEVECSLELDNMWANESI
ncbi:MAG: hypothetical protein H8E55_38235 [Pelagibacterales bacterium]|nr:hypothetical protein [Pelagibacterales bacterium]